MPPFDDRGATPLLQTSHDPLRHPRTNFDCENLARFLNELGGGRRGPGPNAQCSVFCGDRPMKERQIALEASKRQGERARAGPRRPLAQTSREGGDARFS